MVGSRPGRPITISAPSQAAAKIHNFHLKKTTRRSSKAKNFCLTKIIICHKRILVTAPKNTNILLVYQAHYIPRVWTEHIQIWSLHASSGMPLKKLDICRHTDTQTVQKNTKLLGHWKMYLSFGVLRRNDHLSRIFQGHPADLSKGPCPWASPTERLPESR